MPGGFYPKGVSGKYWTSCLTLLAAYQQLHHTISNMSAVGCKTCIIKCAVIVLAGNTTVTEINANSTRTCSSGAIGMASLSVVTVAAVALAAAFAL